MLEWTTTNLLYGEFVEKAKAAAPVECMTAVSLGCRYAAVPSVQKTKSNVLSLHR